MSLKDLILHRFYLILFINDVSFKNLLMLLFADDLKIFRIIKTSDNATMLQNYLNQLCTWCNHNKLYLNISKCKLTTFSRNRSPHLYNYYSNDLELTRVKQNKHLGIFFGISLSFNAYYTHVQSKASSMLGFITRSGKNFKNPIVLKSLYCVYVRSILDYNSIVWSPCMFGPNEA